MGRWLLVVLVTLVAGCGGTLEDGYKPKPLGASDAVRRAYYASPFTPEAKAGLQDRDQELDSRRPRPGY